MNVTFDLGTFGAKPSTQTIAQSELYNFLYEG